eukprot:Gb_36735 [translate_table: standard]
MFLLHLHYLHWRIISCLLHRRPLQEVCYVLGSNPGNDHRGTEIASKTMETLMGLCWVGVRITEEKSNQQWRQVGGSIPRDCGLVHEGGILQNSCLKGFCKAFELDGLSGGWKQGLCAGLNPREYVDVALMYPLFALLLYKYI